MPPRTNPLFPSNDQPPVDSGYIDLHPELPSKPPKPVPPADTSVNSAITMIRDKLARIYAEAPNPFEKPQPQPAPLPRSKHQAFMAELQSSGRSLADIQTAWHNYYVGLPDHEKHEVWQEFYSANAGMRQQSTLAKPAPAPEPAKVPKPEPAPAILAPNPITTSDRRSPHEIKMLIHDKITAGGKLNVRHHLQSLGFGLAIGVLTLVITLFSFFNEVIIAPFIQPGRAEGATPIIIDPNAVAIGGTPEVIIPKINLEIPADYTQTADDEETMLNALNNGIVHYPSTVFPGQRGNAAFFGHSSSNILNPGKYKFAFVLLHELQTGDTFYLTYRGKVYVYKVFKRIIVTPDQVGVLDNVSGHRATATLITCDPPGTALNRLVVVGDQISPDPARASGGHNTISSDSTVTALPDNGPSLWDNLTGLFNAN